MTPIAALAILVPCELNPVAIGIDGFHDGEDRMLGVGIVGDESWESDRN